MDCGTSTTMFTWEPLAKRWPRNATSPARPWMPLLPVVNNEQLRLGKRDGLTGRPSTLKCLNAEANPPSSPSTRVYAVEPRPSRWQDCALYLTKMGRSLQATPAPSMTAQVQFSLLKPSLRKPKDG